MTNDHSTDRRKVLSVLWSSPVFLAGCIQSSDPGPPDDSPSDGNSSGNSTDDPASNDDGSEESSPPEEPDDGFSAPQFAVDPLAENEPAADPPLSLSVSVDQREDEPSRLDLALTNESEEAHTLTFEGFVPFPDPFGVHTSEDDRLVLVPGEDTPTPRAEEYVTGQQRRSGSYFAPLEPVEPPETEHSIDLGPGDSVGGTHYVLAEPAPDEERPWTDFPAPKEYYFESEVGVPTADATATVSFGLFVDYYEA